jgi:hypothetical protein
MLHAVCEVLQGRYGRVLSGEVLPKRQRIDVPHQAQSRRRITGTFMLQRCDVLLQP